MHKELLHASPLLALPLFALFLFVAVFVVECVRAIRKPRAEVAREASLPLHEDETHE